MLRFTTKYKASLSKIYQKHNSIEAIREEEEVLEEAPPLHLTTLNLSQIIAKEAISTHNNISNKITTIIKKDSKKEFRKVTMKKKSMKVDGKEVGAGEDTEVGEEEDMCEEKAPSSSDLVLIHKTSQVSKQANRAYLVKVSNRVT